MSLEDIKNRIVEVIIRELELNLQPEEIRNTSRLDDLFGMDSIAITELIIGIEKEFAIRIPAEDISVKIFEDLETLTEYVQMRLRHETAVNKEEQDKTPC